MNRRTETARALIEVGGLMTTAITRRTLLASSAMAAGGLILGGIFRPSVACAEALTHGGESIALNAWLRIGADDTVTIIVSQAEMVRV